jgi:hypothetical protein
MRIRSFLNMARTVSTSSYMDAILVDGSALAVPATQGGKSRGVDLLSI